MRAAALVSADPPWLHLFVGSPRDAEAFLLASVRDMETALGGRVETRLLRGGRCRTVAVLYDEWSAALQFPLVFGENWDAFRDHLADLTWLRAGTVVLCLTDADKLLDHAPEQFATFAAVVVRVLQERNAPAAKERVRPTHLLVQAASAEQEAVRARWAAAGLTAAT
jgi:hypothetical protein